MGERKVLNKYVPWDFDPSKVPRMKREKNKQVEVRMMLPMSVRCNTCGQYMYRGKKFNSRKEDVVGEDYKGLRIFRFYMKCVNCSAPFAIKTDPKTDDYVVEMGASRNFELWREEEVQRHRCCCCCSCCCSCCCWCCCAMSYVGPLTSSTIHVHTHSYTKKLKYKRRRSWRSAKTQ